MELFVHGKRNTHANEEPREAVDSKEGPQQLTDMDGLDRAYEAAPHISTTLLTQQGRR